MAKRPRRRTAAKIATKREQSELVAHAARLAADPTPLIPRTTGKTPHRIERLERRLRRIAKAKDRPARLRWTIRFGSPFHQAYANLLLVGHAGKAERMASMRTPVGDLKYAVRGNVSKRHLVGIQHFRYPEVRILAYRELAQETGGIIWAVEGGTVHTVAGAPPPHEWFDLVLPKMPIRLERHGDTVRCPHFLDVDDPQDPRSPAGLSLQLAAGPTSFLLCRECAHDPALTERGLLARLAVYLIGLSPTKGIRVSPTGTPRTCVHEGDCGWVRHPPEIHAKTLERYRSGGMSEGDLLDRLEPHWEEAVKAAGGRLLVAGTFCHGDDIEGLLDALGTTGDLRDAVRRFIESAPPVLIADDRSTNKVLEACWSVAPKVLAAIHPDTAALERLLERHKRSQPMQILEEVLVARAAADAMHGYPRYEDLTDRAALADLLAQAHRIGGAARVTEEVDRALKRASHKGLLWAALRHVGATQGREWQFQKNDQEAGEFLEAPIARLFDANADQYHEALAELHTLSGGAGELPAPTGRHGGG